MPSASGLGRKVSFPLIEIPHALASSELRTKPRQLHPRRASVNILHSLNKCCCPSDCCCSTNAGAIGSQPSFPRSLQYRTSSLCDDNPAPACCNSGTPAENDQDPVSAEFTLPRNAPGAENPAEGSVLVLLLSEKTHLQKLEMLQLRFYQPIRESRIISKENEELIFGNIEELVEFHRLFYLSLRYEQQQNRSSGQGNSNSDHMEGYGRVLLEFFVGEKFGQFQEVSAAAVQRHQAASKALASEISTNRRLSQFLEDVACHCGCTCMDLKHLINLEFERLSAYPSLLQDILDKMDAHDDSNADNCSKEHELYKQILIAQRGAQHLLASAKAARKSFEGQQILRGIQGRLDTSAFDRAATNGLSEFSFLDLRSHILIRESRVAWRIFKHLPTLVNLHMVLTDKVLVLLFVHEATGKIKETPKLKLLPNVAPIEKLKHRPILFPEDCYARTKADDPSAFYLIQETLDSEPLVFELLAESTKARDGWLKVLRRYAKDRRRQCLGLKTSSFGTDSRCSTPDSTVNTVTSKDTPMREMTAVRRLAKEPSQISSSTVDSSPAEDTVELPATARRSEDPSEAYFSADEGKKVTSNSTVSNAGHSSNSLRFVASLDKLKQIDSRIEANLARLLKASMALRLQEGAIRLKAEPPDSAGKSMEDMVTISANCLLSSLAPLTTQSNRRCKGATSQNASAIQTSRKILKSLLNVLVDTEAVINAFSETLPQARSTNGKLPAVQPKAVELVERNTSIAMINTKLYSCITQKLKLLKSAEAQVSSCSGRNPVKRLVCSCPSEEHDEGCGPRQVALIGDYAQKLLANVSLLCDTNSQLNQILGLFRSTLANTLRGRLTPISGAVISFEQRQRAFAQISIDTIGMAMLVNELSSDLFRRELEGSQESQQLYNQAKNCPDISLVKL